MMKKKLPYILALLLAPWSLLSAREPVLQFFEENSYVPRSWDELENISFDVENEEINFNFLDSSSISLPLSESVSVASGYSIPHIEITTADPLNEIPNKVDYKDADFVLSGFGQQDDMSTSVKIRGRGNTSWKFPKKPYRLKFDKKVSLCGLPSAKNYVLLANYTDHTMMQFAIATWVGRLLDLPYTNSVVPVDVTLNGIYKGSYILTNKPGINAGSVDIDEENSIMWEMDIYYDEDYKFRSPILDLPVMAVDPDMTDELFEFWKADFIEMEEAVVSSKGARGSEFFDMDNLAKYILVHQICDNNEGGYPKSVKMYKTLGSKYMAGPVWDFDVAFSYNWDEGTGYSYDHIDEGIWINSLFWQMIYREDYVRAVKTNWAIIRDNFQGLLDYIDEYAEALRNSAVRNRALYSKYDDFDESVAEMKAWLIRRFEELDKVDGLLY